MYSVLYLFILTSHGGENGHLLKYLRTYGHDRIDLAVSSLAVLLTLVQKRLAKAVCLFSIVHEV